MTKNQRPSAFPLWVKLLFLFCCGGLIVAVVTVMNSKDAVDVVENQLVALSNNSISEAYYEYTATEFQKTTTLPQFRKFISFYPVLFDNRAHRLKLNEAEKTRAQVAGILVSQELEEMKADWGLVKENGEWKVLSLRLTELQTEDEEARITGPMVDFAKNQLHTMRNQDFVEAYYGFVSRDFQQEISIADFKAFVEDNPILLYYRTIDSEEGYVENDRGYVTLSLENERGNYLLKYTLSKELGDWKVFSLKVVVPPEVAVQKAETNPEALVPPIKDLLHALAEEHIDLAYQQTAKEFQDSTSFEGFQQYLSSFPAFLDRELADIKRGDIQNGKGKVLVNLHDDNGITVVEFLMGFSEGEWDIWGIEVVDAPENREGSLNTIVENEPVPLADLLLAALRQQMTYLYHQDIDEAYTLMMSENYRSENTMNAFEEFFKAHPMFLDYRTSYFNRILEEDGDVVLRGFLTTFDQETFPVRFDFKNEHGEWKIDGMYLLERHEPIAEAEDVLDKPAGNFPPKPLAFTKVVLGTEVDNTGVVVKPLKVMDWNANILFFNVYLDNGQPKTFVTLFLEHVDSGSSAPPLSTMLVKEGESAIAFSYAAPEDGWPPGDYIVKVQSSSGQEYLFKFSIEEKPVSTK